MTVARISAGLFFVNISVFQLRMLLLLLTLLAALASANASTRQYYIVPVNSTALCQHYPAGTCFTLDQLSSQISDEFTGNLTLSFLPGEHTLSWNLRLRGATDITLNRVFPQNISRIRFLPNTGLDLVSINHLEIVGLVMHSSKRSSNGGAVSVTQAASVTIKDCQFINNYVHGHLVYGGAIYLKYSTFVSIESSTFVNNSVAAECIICNGGALYFLESHVEISASHFLFNEADAGGGAVFGTGLNTDDDKILWLSLVDSHFTGNRAESGGAIYYSAMRGLQPWKCTFTSNKVSSKGGAIATLGAAVLSMQNVYSGNSGTYGGAFYGLLLVKSEFNMDSFVNNSAHIGAVIYQQFADIKVVSSSLTNNEHTSGGTGVVYALQVTLDITDVTFTSNLGSVYAINSEVSYSGDTTHNNNTEESGGAITIINSVLTFEEYSCTIISDNAASYGGGLYMDQSTAYMYGTSSILITHNTAHILGGGVYASQSTLEFKLYPNHNPSETWYAYIADNIAEKDGGGIYLVASSIRLSNTYIDIIHNTARRNGGGLYADEASEFVLTKLSQDGPDSSSYIQSTFTNNSALRGGAVYISDATSSHELCESRGSVTSESIGTEECFFQTLRLYQENNINCITNVALIFFEENTAMEAGNDIYGGLLDRCTLSPIAELVFLEPKAKFFNGLEYLNATAHFSQNITSMSDFYEHISSAPVKVCFCENITSNCEVEHSTVRVKKGETFTLSLTAVDQVGKPVHANLISSLLSDKDGIGRLKEGQQNRPIHDHCTVLDYNVYSNEGMAVLELYADGPCTNIGVSKRQVNISFLACNCPIGLQEEHIPPVIDCKCDCDNRIKSFVSNCSALDGSVLIDENVWIEYTNTSNVSGFVTHDCSFDYCAERPVVVSFSSRYETDRQCAFNRTGVLCGECGAGLSLVFASSNCQRCSNYYLFLLLPFAVAGVALVTFILMLNMTVATGTIHGLIFYANILAANQSIFLPFDTPNFLTVFISWLNLDIGIETCFYDGMDSYAKFLLQLAFPTYVFFLIIVFILLAPFFPKKVSNFIGKKNPEATLYTLVLLSYSKIIRTIIIALQFTVIYYPDRSQKLVWLYDANVPYFSASQIPRFLIATMVTIVGTLYTTLLLFGQLFDRCSQHRLMKWTTHKYYIHFMKAHHAPLSDQHRYWIGVLLLARLIHYLISAFSSDMVVVLSAGVIPLVLLVYKLLVHFLHPHVSKLLHLRHTQETPKQTLVIYNSLELDVLETTFLVNLVALALARFYVGEIIWNQQVLAYVSMALSLVTLVVIVLYHTGIFNIKLFRKLRLTIKSCWRHDQAPPGEEGELILDGENDNNEDEPLLQGEEVEEYEYTGRGVTANNPAPNDPAHYNTPPIIQRAVPDDQLREPALDELAPVQQEDYNIVITPAPRRNRREMTTFTEIDIRGH